MEGFLEDMLIFVTILGIAFINFMTGYDEGHSDGTAEACKQIEYVTLEVKQLENDIRMCRIERVIVRRKYNDLQRKIRAMEGLAE